MRNIRMVKVLIRWSALMRGVKRNCHCWWHSFSLLAMQLLMTQIFTVGDAVVDDTAFHCWWCSSSALMREVKRNCNCWWHSFSLLVMQLLMTQLFTVGDAVVQRWWLGRWSVIVTVDDADFHCWWCSCWWHRFSLLVMQLITVDEIKLVTVDD